MQQRGNKWLRDNKFVALRLPSAAVPRGLEQCIVVNPLHAGIRKLKLEESLTEIYGDRLFTDVH